MKNCLDKVDLFTTLGSYRGIYDNLEYKSKAEKLYNETLDLNKVDTLCKSFILKDKSEILLQKSKLNKRFAKATFENFKVEDKLRNSFIQSQRICQNIETYLEEGVNLIFAGNGCVGTGKTHLASAVAKELMINKVFLANL
jgi:DNA replication protein DnaC